MKTYIREKKIYCGDYREVDIYPYSDDRQRAVKGRRSKKQQVSAPKQRGLNDKNARRYLTQLGNLNFGADDLHVTTTYSKANLPATIEEAEREASNFLRRIQYRRKKAGLEALKYIMVTAYSTGKDGETPVRIHHHIIINGGLDRDEVENLWRKRRPAGKKQGEKIGYINADRLQPDENGIAALCNYLSRQPNGKKRWSSSHNLLKPTCRNNDNRYSRKQLERIARERPGREFWESRYPGWTFTDADHGVEYQYNEHTGWSIYLKLRRRE